MSDLLSRAAEAMGIPEPLAERSARARAEASGQSYEDVLAAWAGGQAVAAAPAEAPATTETAPAEEPAPEQAPAGEPAAPAPAAPAAPPPSPEPAVVARPTGPAQPPVLEAEPDRPLVTVAGGLLVAVVMALLGFVFPSLPAETEEIRSSFIEYSELADQGHDVDLSTGCASCHTQSIRAVVADVGIGPVTLADTNQALGYRRIGPDLSNVGGRRSADEIRSVLTNGTHPAMPLSGAAVDALTAFLVESKYLEEES